MQRRRQTKLERKLNEISGSDRGSDSGGTLKIYGNSVCPEVPYKTLLLSITDNAFHVVKETLEKYKLEKENPNDYCIVQVISPTEAEQYYGVPPKEIVLNDYDCPLDILYDNPQLAGSGCITFHLRHRDGNLRRWKGGNLLAEGPPKSPVSAPETLPYLVEVNPDGTRPHDAHSFALPLNGLEIGRERSSAGDGTLHLQLTGNDILPRHCLLSWHGSTVTVSPLSPDAFVAVNNSRVYDRAVLEHGMMLLLGRTHFFRFHDPFYNDARKNVPMNSLSGPVLLAQNNEQDLLPAILEYREQGEDRLLSAAISEVNLSDLHFKLQPAYVVYMAARYSLMCQLRSGANSSFRASPLTALCSKVVRRIHQVIQQNQNYAGGLAFWMANSSELLNFLSRDRGLSAYTVEAQEQLADCVQLAFTSLVHCLQEDLSQSMPAFLDPTPDLTEASDEMVKKLRQSGRPSMDDVISILTSIMSLLLTMSVNAALTIQLFSQMFHFINMWLFNRLVRDRQLCTHEWGRLLRHRLRHIEDWSEKQGLELAAECHLARIIQGALLLELPKIGSDDITVICSSCFKLNSLQLSRLLDNYIPGPGEPSVTPDFIERVVSIAQNTADETARNEGQEIRLMEDTELHLPFLMPDDGYSCDFVKGLVRDLVEFVEPLSQAGLCQLIVNKGPQNSAGLWTVHFAPAENSDSAGSFQVVEPSRKTFQGALPPVPEITVVSFRKLKNSLGLSIVAAIGEGQNVRRIYIKSVVPGGAAAADGRLQAGDELLEVDGQSLVGMSQEDAAAVMSQTGQVVTLKVAKQSAVYHGLATQLGSQSPTTQNVPAHGGGGPSASAVLPPGISRQFSGEVSHLVQPYSGNMDAARPLQQGPAYAQGQGTFRPPPSQRPVYPQGQGSVYPQSQPLPASLQQNRYPSQPNVNSYPSENLRRSQPTLTQSDYNQPAVQSFGRPMMMTNGVGVKANPTQAPTGGRYSKAAPSSSGAPYRSKSVPDFDQVDFGGEPRGRPSTGGVKYYDPYQQQKPGDNSKRPILHQSTRELYSGSNYPPMRPPPAAGKAVSFANSEKRQFGRSGKPPNSFTSSQAKSVAPPRQTNVYTPTSSNHKSQVAQQRPFETGGQTKDPRSVGANKGSSLMRYPNTTGLNAVGLNDRYDPHPQTVTQNRSGNAYPYQTNIPYSSQPPSSVHPPPGSQGYAPRGSSVRYEKPYYSGSRTQHQEGFAPPVSQPPSSIYASVSKGPAQQNYTSAGPGPTGYQDSRLNPAQTSDYKEPEYAKIRPRPNPNGSQAPPLPRSTMVSPWVREEQEVEKNRREEEKRQMRAEEIYELERRPNLTKEEVERLKRHKLEAEFDRRLEEVNNQDDQDRDDTEITPAGRAKLVKHYQQEYEMRRQQMEAERMRREKDQMKDQEMKRQWQEQHLKELERQREDEKRMELQRQEQHMKQTEDYLRRQRGSEQMQNAQKSIFLPPRPVEPEIDTYTIEKKPSQILPPPPPDRSSSFEVFHAGNTAPLKTYGPLVTDVNSNAVRNMPTSFTASQTKKNVSFQSYNSRNAESNQFHSTPVDVSFQRPVEPVKSALDYSKQTRSLNVPNDSYYRTVEPPTPFTPGTNDVFIVDRGTTDTGYQRQNASQNTPGVIGTQELYLDPRERIAASKMASALNSNIFTTPERMSFRDKMKHFAIEAGEGTPKDKSKISKAQQLLENDLNVQ